MRVHKFVSEITQEILFTI